MTDSAIQMEKTKKYDIPLSCLDYAYISDCTNVKELEKIIKILRSGEEGHFPELETKAMERLELLNPKSRMLRQDTPVIKSSELKKEDQLEINEDLLQWTSSMKNLEKGGGEDTSANLPPVRKGEISISSTQEEAKSKSDKRALPRSYNEWDKIDIEKELEEVDKKNDAQERKLFKDLKSNFDFDMPSVIHSEGMSMEEKMMRANREKDKGNEALKSGDIAESVLYYTRSLSLIETAAVHNNRALAYIKGEKWTEAIEDCQQVLTEEKDNLKALLRISSAYVGLKEADAAEKNLELVLSQDSGNKKAQELLRKCEEIRKEKAERKQKGRRMVIEEVDDAETTVTNGNQTSTNETETKPQTIPVSRQNGIHEDPKKIKNTKIKDDSKKKEEPTKKEESKKKDDNDIWSLDEIENLVNVNDKVDLSAMGMGIDNPNVMPQKPPGYKMNYSNYDDDEKDDECIPELEVEKPPGVKIREITDEEAQEITDSQTIREIADDVHQMSGKKVTELINEKLSNSAETGSETKKMEEADWSTKSGARPKSISPQASEASDQATEESNTTVELIEDRFARPIYKQEKLPRKLVAVKEEGSMLFREGQYGKAILRYTTLIEELEKDSIHQVVNLSLMYSNRAACYLKTGHCKAAMKDCERSLENIPHTIKPLLRHAAACEHLEKYRQAYVDYWHILSIDSSVQLAQSGSTRCQNILHQWDGTMWREKLPPMVIVTPREVPEIVLDDSVSGKSELTPPPEDLPNPDLEFEECKKQGNAFVKIGDYQKAVEWYCKCIALDPENSIGFTNRALCYLKLNKAAEAVTDCNQALAVDSCNCKALYRRALARKMLGEKKESLKDLGEVLKLDAKNVAAKKEFDIIMQSYKEEQKLIKESTPPAEVETKKKSHRIQIEEVDEEEISIKDSVQSKVSPKQTTEKANKTEDQQSNNSSPRSTSRKSSEEPPEQTSKSQKHKKQKDRPSIEIPVTTTNPSKTTPTISNPARKLSKEEEIQKIQEDLEWLDPKQPEAPLSKSAKRRMKAKAKKGGSVERTLDEEDENKSEGNIKNQIGDLKDLSVAHSEKTPSQASSKTSSKGTTDTKTIEKQTNSKSSSASVPIKESRVEGVKSGGESGEGEKLGKRKKKSASKESSPVTGLPVTPSSNARINSTPYEFMTAWNGVKSKDVESYSHILKQVPPSDLPKVISNKLDGEMLSVILKCVEKDFISKGEIDLSYKILKNLPKIKRFSTIAMMISADEKKNLKNVFSELKTKCGSETEFSVKDVESLQTTYSVK